MIEGKVDVTAVVEVWDVAKQDFVGENCFVDDVVRFRCSLSTWGGNGVFADLGVEDSL